MRKRDDHFLRSCSFDVCFSSRLSADFSNAVCSPSGSPKRSDHVGVAYWQVRSVVAHHYCNCLT